MKEKNLVLPNLGLCVFMDIIGMATYIFPFLGEFSDIVWAPVSALIFNQLFGGKLGIFGGMFNFLEEIIPFTDIIPSFTIAWYIRKQEMAKVPGRV